MVFKKEGGCFMETDKEMRESLEQDFSIPK
jgi:hypothetical protein